ncbi:MAG: hypothetical protein Q7J43_14110 [Pseudomonas sp.]|uniref:hypothetical protein n=1 Tax=Pseudomonas sp. TaxID=306 RepID=UPI0027290E0E|nr:hypothetical protein [Pseudomonas sp.]MDO9618799.1 hypothetical protein [Pseudomonas sp.]MDP2446941.1 hypothetical protein [Pseudomonas sp.]MDZ4335847.1 hypothetical protein [Pseudomonas sp.]
MMRFLFARRQAFICLAWLLPAGSWAESPDPLDAQAATPAVHYQSPLKAYQGFSEQPLHNWREANELVGRIGGWRTYAQEPYAQEPNPQEPYSQEVPAQQPAEPPTKPMEPHHGHH